MARDTERGSLFRPILPKQHSRVTYAELLFDLVFVFAVTQISHTLLGRFTPLGALQTGLLLLAVWWVWVYTSWITNWLNPEQTPVRLLLFSLMLGGLVLSTSIPKAFESRGLWFAIAYAAMQVGKTVFLWASTPPNSLARMNAVRITAWLSVSAVFWIGGGLAQDQFAAGALGAGACDRIHLARGAVLDTEIRRVLDGGLVRRGRPYGRALRRVHHHRARGIHCRHRCDVRRSDLDRRNRRGLPVGLYRRAGDVVDLFPQGGRGGSELISNSSEPGRLARLAYTYLHLPIVAGIILSAVADELVLQHPGGHSGPRTVLSAIGGPLLFLIGTILFKHAIRGWFQLSHVAGIVLLGLLSWFASGLSPLLLSLLTSAILIVVAAGSRSRSNPVRPKLTPRPPAREPKTCAPHRSTIPAASSPNLWQAR